MTSARGSDGSFPTQRIARYSILDSSWADSCIFGAITPMEPLERLIVCDGQPQRGFRQAVFNSDFSLCGICCYYHSTHENIVQVLYVNKLLKKGEMPTLTLEGTNKKIDAEMLKKLTQNSQGERPKSKGKPAGATAPIKPVTAPATATYVKDNNDPDSRLKLNNLQSSSHSGGSQKPALVVKP